MHNMFPLLYGTPYILIKKKPIFYVQPISGSQRVHMCMGTNI